MTTADDALVAFCATVGFEGPLTVVGVGGEVDMFRAPELAALLDAVIDRVQPFGSVATTTR